MTKYDDRQKKWTMDYLKTLKTVQFRVKPDEYERWENAAKQAGFTSMRQFYLHCIEKETERIEKGQ